MHFSSSTEGVLTRGLTGNASISSGGNGTRRGAREFGSWTDASSHRPYSLGETITGIQLWIGARTAFAAVVRIGHVSMPFLSGLSHRFHNPANANRR